MGNAIRVLLVDDDTAVAKLTATYLKRASEDITTTVETGPADALARVTGDESVDCVVSDYDMPEMDGLTFLDEVRAVAPELPFILFTGKGSEEIASEAISSGVTDYLQKETGTDHYTVLANRVENAVAQHRAERQADEANERIRRIFERITDAFYAFDDDWRVTYANQQAADHTDRSQRELIGEDIRRVLPESDGRELYDSFDQAFETQEPVTLETESVLRPDQWIEVRVYPSEDGLSVYFRDTTERKRAQMELRETKQKIEALHDVAARAVACTSEQEIYDLAVETAEEILEFDLCTVDAVEDDRLISRAVSKVVATDGYYETTPIDAEGNLAALAAREWESSLVEDLRETEMVPAESEYRSVLTVPIGEFAVFQAVSKDLGGFDEADRDLTELLAAHLDEALTRVKSETELRDERDRFAALFENVPNAVVRYDSSDDAAICRSVNTAFEEVFGWTAEEMVGESVDDYILPDDEWEAGKSLNSRVRRGGRIEGEEVHRRTRDGGRDFLLHTAPSRNRDDSEAFAIYVDITDQKERERKLARQNERLEEFASVVSHDLRNPLNVACGRYDLLADESDAEHLEPLGRALDRMDALVEDLLALARQGQVVDDFEQVSLASAAETAWETVETEAATLSLDEDAVIQADEPRFRELLENLFGNAVEHGDSDVAVEVGPLAAGDRTCSSEGRPTRGFYVEDDGSGISEANSEKVLEHGFTTTDDGTGFGLAIVSSIAEAHGWRTSVCESDAGGARFEFTRVAIREKP
ncbi:PAS domain S-box protein [Halorussus amylolyticus]|uniref:PAS domain S-box protein n=1 Tax=Halorussus amylolyticus TaxID=1126242 RepID=UPI00104D470E|nr:PAS domain S-box protein [Halorussus amylolyticus]